MKKTFMKVLRGMLAVGLAAFVGLSSTALATESAHIESKLLVANATRRDVNYTPSTDALVDQVVKFEIWYHNTENPDSGRTANNLNVKINIPSTKTKTHVATSTVGGSNTNTVVSNATVTTKIDTTLNYIPGTAVRRHNVGTNANPVWRTDAISDSVVSASGFTIPAMNPCNNFQESIYVQARVNAAVISVQKFVKIEGTDTWLTTTSAKPGDKLAFVILVKNEGNVKLTNVLVRDSFPPKLNFDKGSAVLTNSGFPNGITVDDNLVNGGIFIGDHMPGGASRIRFTATVPMDAPEGCMLHTNVVNVKANETEFFHNEASVNVCKTTPPPPPPPTPPVTPPTETTTLPVSGPLDAAGAAGAGTSLLGGAFAWIRSKKHLISAIKK